jgi:hypothetical protein
MSNSPRITAAERRQNEQIRQQRKVEASREEWAAVVIDEIGKRQYVADRSVADREFTTAPGSSKRYPTREKAIEGAESHRTYRRRRDPRDDEPVNVPHWETLRREWITGVDAEQVK